MIRKIRNFITLLNIREIVCTCVVLRDAKNDRKSQILLTLLVGASNVFNSPSSITYCGICVVFPEPVSPITIVTKFERTVSRICERHAKIGNGVVSILDIL